jgi:DNA-binding IclR family transcriptional regulator
VPEISKTADQVLAVLEAVAEHGPVTPTELARRLRMHRTVVHRSLATLHRRGFVRRGADGYVPGVANLRIAQRVEPHLLAAARPVLERLAHDHGETFILSVPDGGDAVQVDQAVGSRHFVSVQIARGFRHPLARGASGRAILAFLGEDEAERAAARAGDAAGALRRQLGEIRRAGYAVSHDELSESVHGLSVPVKARGAVVASLGVVLPSVRAAQLLEFVPVMKRAAASIGQGFGRA